MVMQHLVIKMTNIDGQVVDGMENVQRVSAFLMSFTISSLQASVVMCLVIGTAVMINCAVIIIAVTRLSALSDGSTVNVSMVITRLTITLKNIFRCVIVINIVDTQLTAVDLVTKDIVIRITAAAHETVPGVNDIEVIVNLTPRLHLCTVVQL